MTPASLMHDLSVPIFIHGKHWGGLRLGYRPEGAEPGKAAAPAAQGLSLALNG